MLPLQLIDHQVIQRNDAQSARVLYEVPADTRGTEAVGPNQPTIAGEVAGGVGQLTLPVGGPYDVLSVTPSGDREVLARDVLVGDLWLMAGQSNMMGAAPMHDLLEPDPSLRVLDLLRVWRPAAEPLHHLLTDEVPHRGVGLGSSFGNAMIAATGVPIGLIATAQAAVSLEDWSADHRGAPDGSLYGFMLQTVAMTGGRVAGVLWYQGESDAAEARHGDYAPRLRRFIACLREDVGGPQLPVHVVQLSRVVGESRGDVPAAWMAIQRIQSDLANTGATSATATIDLTLHDAIHLDVPGQRRLGRRLARAALGQPMPHLERAEIDAHNDRCLRVHVGGTIGALSPTNRIAGFSVRDAQEHDLGLIIEAAVAPDDIAVVNLRLRRPLLPGEWLWYGHGTDPHVNLVDAADAALPVFGPILSLPGTSKLLS
ncbi:MAG: sialate O-acetylesterase [Glaciecola sp.]|jgi:sialate O-acetylesterase